MPDIDWQQYSKTDIERINLSDKEYQKPLNEKHKRFMAIINLIIEKSIVDDDDQKKDLKNFLIKKSSFIDFENLNPIAYTLGYLILNKKFTDIDKVKFDKYKKKLNEYEGVVPEDLIRYGIWMINNLKKE